MRHDAPLAPLDIDLEEVERKAGLEILMQSYIRLAEERSFRLLDQWPFFFVAP